MCLIYSHLYNRKIHCQYQNDNHHDSVYYSTYRDFRSPSVVVCVPVLQDPQMLTSVQTDGVLHNSARKVFRQPIRFEGAFR